MNIRKVNIDDFDDILNLQLQLEDVEVKFDTNLKKNVLQLIKEKKS